jgi:hypothetical protein
MSMGVEESLALERVEGGGDLFFISGGGMEDMVVEGRPARGMRTSRLRLLNHQLVFVGEKMVTVVSPTQNHVRHYCLGHALVSSQRRSLRKTSDAPVAN